jgi:hypothetical protein
MPETMRSRLSAAVLAGLGRAGRGTTKQAAAQASEKLTELGIMGLHAHSTEEDLADWEDRLWHDQDDPLEERQKEWRLHLHYASNEQFLAYHKARREWVVRKTVPWRIRSIYNVISKAAELRTARMTENKPTIAVQAATADVKDVERAEYKETLFWGLWEKLRLHIAIVEARTWASLIGSGFLKCGFDPDAGCEYPATRKRPRYETMEIDEVDERGQPTGNKIPQRIYAGLEEIYLDAKGNELGPVEELVDDPDLPGQQKRIRNAIPDNADVYHEGEAYVDVRSSFNLRWDRYVDDPSESWYIQDGEILPGSKIVAMWPDSVDALKEARAVSEEEKATQWTGLNERDPTSAGLSERRHAQAKADLAGELDKEYFVRETWVFPKNPFLKKLWGKKGFLLVTVGGKVIHKSELPSWALKQCPFIRFIDIPEKGNHYGKSFLRDLIPLQDDINRSRSQMAERQALESRLILGAPQQHGINLRLMGGMPGVLVTYRSKDHQPQPLQLSQQGQGSEVFYRMSLEAAADLGNMNEASTGKLPSAGLAAKAIYALQYADERSISKTSTLQDESLKQLARALDAITRDEYKEARKVRLTGADRSFLVETDILPEHLDTDVDYYFTPGSMMSRQKESVKNELLTLLDKQLINPATVMKHFATAVPDIFRVSHDLHDAKARRTLQKILRRGARDIQPDPFDNPLVHIGVLEEFMLSSKFELLGDEERETIVQLWQAYKAMVGVQAPAPVDPAQPVDPAAAGSGAPTPAMPAPGQEFDTSGGAEQLADEAEADVAPPPGYGA